MANDTAYAKTKKDLAEALGISTQALYKWTSKPGFPARTRRGWNVKKCVDYYQADHARRNGSNGAKSEAEQEQLRLRNLLLAEKLAKAKGERMPVEDHLLEIQSHAQIVTDGMRNFVDDARAVDKSLGKKAERIARRILRRLQRAVSNA